LISLNNCNCTLVYIFYSKKLILKTYLILTFDSSIKSSVAELKPRYCHLFLYLFNLESLILSIILVLVKELSHKHYILVSYTKMLQLETKNNPIHKTYLKGKCLILFNKGLEFLLEKSFLTMLIAITQRTKNVDHNIGLTHKCIKVIYTSHLESIL